MMHGQTNIKFPLFKFTLELSVFSNQLSIGVKAAVLQHVFEQVFIAVGVSENSAVKTVLHEDGADGRRNASDY